MPYRRSRPLPGRHLKVRVSAKSLSQSVTANKRRIAASTLLIVVVILLTFAAITFVLWLGARSVLEGAMSPGQLGQFVLYAAIAAGANGQSCRKSGVSFNAPPEPWNDSPSCWIFVRTFNRRTPPVPFPEPPLSVEFDGVRFAYPLRPNDNVLKSLSFAVPAGETVALVGPSGAGKSTIFQLLLRFYDPAEGSVSINGVDLRQLDLKALRTALGWCPRMS